MIHTMTMPRFTAEDVRQYVYCPRIIFFRYVLKYFPAPTGKMKKGMEVHESTARKKTRAKKTKCAIYYNLFLENDDLGICALLDMVEVHQASDELIVQNYPAAQYLGELLTTTDQIGIVIELKTGQTRQSIAEHHKAQLTAQALLVERTFNIPVFQGKVQYIQDKSEITSIIWPEDKLNVLNILKKMKNIISDEIIPRATSIKEKCHDCEFWRVCMRG